MSVGTEGQGMAFISYGVDLKEESDFNAGKSIDLLT
jgi:hypothetical protein